MLQGCAPKPSSDLQRKIRSGGRSRSKTTRASSYNTDEAGNSAAPNLFTASPRQGFSLRSAFRAAYCESRLATPTRSWEHLTESPDIRCRPSAMHGIAWDLASASQYGHTGSWATPSAIPGVGGIARKAGVEFRVPSRKSGARTAKSLRPASGGSAGICVQPSQGLRLKEIVGVRHPDPVLGTWYPIGKDQNCEVVLKGMRLKSRVCLPAVPALLPSHRSIGTACFRYGLLSGRFGKAVISVIDERGRHGKETPALAANFRTLCFLSRDS